MTQAELAGGTTDAGQASPAKGQLIQDVTLTSTLGQEISLSDYRGRSNLVLVFAGEGVGNPDLKGKNVGIQGLGSSQYTFLSTMAAHVGLDPVKDIRWVTSASPKPMELFAEGKIDAFLGFPPEPQELRARLRSLMLGRQAGPSKREARVQYT